MKRIAVLALFLSGCVSMSSLKTERRQKDLVGWVRHYELQMGLTPVGIVFGTLPGSWCGAAFRSLAWQGEWIAFDTGKKRCLTWPTREQALHELCHIRYAHPYVPMSEAQKHREVVVCADHYR